MAYRRRERIVFRTSSLIPALLLVVAFWLGFQDSPGTRVLAALLLLAALGSSAFLVWTRQIIAAYSREREQTSAALAAAERALQSSQSDRSGAELQVRADARAAHVEQVNRDLQHFMYIAGHDLQEPVRVILSYVALLEKAFEGRLDENTEKYLMFVSQGAKRMQTLVGDIVSYSRTSSESFALNPEPLATPLSEARYTLLTSIRESGAEISVGPLPDVEIDDAKMSLVFQHLLSNAIKFRKPGEPPRIKIDAVKIDTPDSDGPEWQVSVRDEGIGFDPKYAEKIFGAFQRLHSSSAYPGSGIGLALCKGIVEGHGGRIWAESSPGRGAAFFFTLPAHASVGSEAASASRR